VPPSPSRFKTSVWYHQFSAVRSMSLAFSPPLFQAFLLTKNVTNTFSLQALQKSEARGKILHYTVTFEALSHGESKAIETNVTTQTNYTRVTPKMDYKITVTADNSRGSSPPASILTNVGIQGKAFHCSQPLEIIPALLCTAHGYAP